MKARGNEKPFLQPELIGIVESHKPDAELRVSLLGSGITDIDKIAAGHIKNKLSVYGIQDVSIGRNTLSI